MAKKIIFALLALFTIVVLINIWTVFALQKNVKQYLSLNIERNNDEQLIKNSAENIIKNYEKINKNLKKILFKDFSEDLSKILTHFLHKENISYLVLLQNSDELRATGGFIGSYFFLEFSHGMWNLTPVQDIYNIAGQQKSFPTSPPGHYEYLSEGKGLLIQDANWWPDLTTSAEKIINLWQEIAAQSPYLDHNRDIAGIIFVNLDLIESLLEQIGPIQLPDYESAIDSQNFAQLARADRLNFFAGSTEKANFLNHSKAAIENRLSQLNFKENQALINVLFDNLENKNIQIYSRDKELEKIWQKHNFAGQMLRKNLNNFYFYSVESNVGINKANRLVEREFHFYQNDEQIEQIRIKFSNKNQKPLNINTNPDLNTADHLSYVNFQRLYFAPEIKIKQIQLIDENGKAETIDFLSQAYFQENQEFLEISFLLLITEQEQLDLVIDLENNSKQQDLEVQKQSGIKEIPIYFYQNQDLVDNWTLTRDRLE